MTTAGGQQDIMIAEFDPWQHRKRIAMTRSQVAAILDLREDVHIIGMEAHSDPMFLLITVASARFSEAPEDNEARLDHGETVPTEQGARWREHRANYLGPGQMQNEREPAWMEGWRKAIEWLRDDDLYHTDSKDVRHVIADQMETRLP